MPRFDDKLALIELPGLEINEKNEFYVDEKIYIIPHKYLAQLDLEKADLVYEKGQWV